MEIGEKTMENNSDNGRYDSVEVAKYIAAYWNGAGSDINMTKLQKLLYIAYGSWLAVIGNRLCNEQPQAWPYGPVFPTTRNKLSKVDLNKISVVDKELKNISNDIIFNNLLKIMFKSFGKWSASKLTEWSHKDDSPWYFTTQSPDFKWGRAIEDAIIQDYFNNILE